MSSSEIENSPSISIETIQDLKSLDGGTFLTGLIGTFITHGNSLIQDMKASLQINDHSTIAKRAHTLYGSCGNFGCKPLMVLCREVEAACATGSSETLAGKTLELIDEYAQVERELRSFA